MLLSPSAPRECATLQQLSEPEPGARRRQPLAQGFASHALSPKVALSFLTFVAPFLSDSGSTTATAMSAGRPLPTR
jgi:threonine/homoserine/homoserine lactone efflux protein